MKHIASAANPLYRFLLKLARSSRERRKQGLALIDGVHLLDAYLAHGGKPQHVLVADGTRSGQEIATVARRLPAPPVVLADALFESLTELESPSGILAAIAIPAPQPPLAPGCWLLLEDLQDPGNLGSILRSAAAAGASDTWLSRGCADAWSPKVLRAAMGAHFSLRLHDRADLANAALDAQVR
jgi:TrmH family RNA methyltransferase